MTTYNDTPANIALLASLFGMPPIVARAWLRAEGQATPNVTNPLNIRWYGRPSVGQTTAGFAVYRSASEGLRDAYDIVRRLAPTYGYGVLLDLRGNPDPIAWARAIEASSWAAGHYGARRDRAGLITRLVRQAMAAAATPASEEVSMLPVTDPTPLRVDLPIGTQLWDLSGAPLVKLKSGGRGVYSPFATEGGRRAVVISTGGQIVLALVGGAAITRTVPMTDEALAAENIALSARIAAARQALG